MIIICASTRASVRQSVAGKKAGRLGALRMQCIRCHKTKPNSEFGQRKWKGELVRVRSCRDCAEKACKVQKMFSKTEKGKAIIKNWNSSNGHSEALARYQKTDGYKHAVSKYEKTDKNKAKQKRRHDKIMADAGKKLMKMMTNRISDQMAGRRKESGTLASFTSFASADEARVHFESTFKHGMSMDNYGTAWEIEHRIAKKWYDSSDEDDVRRCWNARNLCALAPKENNNKRIRIPSEDELYQIGVDFWPKSWNGVPPDEATRESWYRLHHDMRMGRA